MSAGARATEKLGHLTAEMATMRVAIDQTELEASHSRSQLAVLDGMKTDRNMMRAAAQGMWLLWQQQLPELRAQALSLR